MSRLLSALLLLMLAGAAEAHAIWFAQRSGELAMIYGHGAEDLDMVARQAKVSQLAAYDEAGQALPARLNPQGKLLLIEGGAPAALLTAVLDNGTWSRDGSGKWLNQPKNRVPGASQAGRYLKYAVSWRSRLDAPMAALPGQALQLQPLQSRLPEQAGDTVRLRVLFQGQPLAGAPVQADLVNDPDGKPQLSDRDGIVSIVVRNQGLNVIGVQHSVAAPGSTEIDHTGYLATLSFALGHAPE